jgi:hypothetical protein
MGFIRPLGRKISAPSKTGLKWPGLWAPPNASEWALAQQPVPNRLRRISPVKLDGRSSSHDCCIKHTESLGALTLIHLAPTFSGRRGTRRRWHSGQASGGAGWGSRDAVVPARHSCTSFMGARLQWRSGLLHPWWSTTSSRWPSQI